LSSLSQLWFFVLGPILALPLSVVAAACVRTVSHDPVKAASVRSGFFALGLTHLAFLLVSVPVGFVLIVVDQLLGDTAAGVLALIWLAAVTAALLLSPSTVWQRIRSMRRPFEITSTALIEDTLSVRNGLRGLGLFYVFALTMPLLSR